MDFMWKSVTKSAQTNRFSCFFFFMWCRQFLLGLHKFGKGYWRNISRNYVVSRTPTQVASHAQKYFIRLSSDNKNKRRSRLWKRKTKKVFYFDFVFMLQNNSVSIKLWLIGFYLDFHLVVRDCSVYSTFSHWNLLEIDFYLLTKNHQQLFNYWCSMTCFSKHC